MRKIHITLVLFWLGCFALCLSFALVHATGLGGEFSRLETQVFDTFAPPLTTMLVFLFEKYRHKRKEVVSVGLDTVAIVVSIIYAGCFVFLIYTMSDATETVGMIQDIRSRSSFLITGMLAFYFLQGNDLQPGGEVQ